MDITPYSLFERRLSLIQHYLERLGDMHHMYSQGHEWAQEALRSFDQDWQQLQAQQQWAVSVAHKDKRAAQLVVAFAQKAKLLLMQVNPEEATVWLQQALVWIDADEFTLRYDLLRTQYDIQTLRLATEHMRSILDELEALVQRIGDQGRLVTVALLTARYYDLTYNNAEQLSWSERALALARHVEDPVLMADALYQLGYAQTRVYQYSKAKECLAQSLDIYQEMGLRLKEAGVLVGLAMNAYYESDYENAIVYGEQALAIDRELGDRPRQLSTLANLAIFTLGVNDLQKALSYGQQAWAATRDGGYQQSADTALIALLLALSSLGLTDDLKIQVEQARAFLHEYPSDYLASLITYSLAEDAYEHEDWHTACQLLGELAASDQRREDIEREYESTLTWASSLVLLEDLDGAAAAFSRGLELYAQEPENPFGWSGALAGLSHVEARRGNRTEAERRLDTFIGLLEQDGVFKVFAASKVLWHAIRAATLLNHPRLPFIHQEANRYLQRTLSYLTDTSLRTSFLNLYTIRQLTAVCTP